MANEPAAFERAPVDAGGEDIFRAGQITHADFAGLLMKYRRRRSFPRRIILPR